jgi:hypothetical protein
VGEFLSGHERQSAKARFAFGENWSHFLADLDEHRIALAETSLREMLAARDL